MSNFPKWLPTNVADHCTAKLSSGALSDEQKEYIIRLATHESMRSVWEALEREVFKQENPDPSKLVNLIEDVRLHPTVLYLEPKKPKLGTANQRKIMTQISKLSKSLLDALAQLDADTKEANKGIQFLLQEVIRLEIIAASQQQGYLVVCMHELQETLQEADASFGIAEILQALQVASEVAMEAPPEGPRKLGAKTATRTALIKDLKRYIQSCFGQKLNQVIATLVNTAMDLPPETITEDMVRKA